MSTLVAQTLSNGTVSTSTANCIQGSAKAWVQFTGSTGTRNGSYNVSSVTRNSIGYFTVNFTNAMANANYAYSVTISPNAGYANNPGSIAANSNGNATLVSPTTSAFSFACFTLTGAGYIDPLQVNVIVLN